MLHDTSERSSFTAVNEPCQSNDKDEKTNENEADSLASNLSNAVVQYRDKNSKDSSLQSTLHKDDIDTEATLFDVANAVTLPSNSSGAMKLVGSNTATGSATEPDIVMSAAADSATIDGSTMNSVVGESAPSLTVKRKFARKSMSRDIVRGLSHSSEQEQGDAISSMEDEPVVVEMIGGNELSTHSSSMDDGDGKWQLKQMPTKRRRTIVQRLEPTICQGSKQHRGRKGMLKRSQDNDVEVIDLTQVEKGTHVYAKWKRKGDPADGVSL
jgi:hypothetical protein